VLKTVLDSQQRVAKGETNTAAGYYFRSDHFNFAKAGVPALYVDSGEDLVDGGTAAGEAASKDYNDNRYHKPADQYDAATWKLDGILAVLDSVYGVGEQLANDDAWPNWYKTNPFRAARDKMMAAKSAAPAK
jgi:Zn-dependent M28 family amino/carboxypeptidase